MPFTVSQLMKVSSKVSLLVLTISSISVLSILKIVPVQAEAIWKPGSSISARNNDPFVNFKAAPCRNFTRTKHTKIFKPGESVLAQWSETRDHFGRFQFNLLQVNIATGREEIVVPKFVDVPDNINGAINGTQFHEFQQNINLPLSLTDNTPIPTGDYVLQLVHQTTPVDAAVDVNNNPAANYYSCADIRIENLNFNDTIAPSNVSNHQLTLIANNYKLDWINPVSNGIATENLAYKLLVLLNPNSAITVTANQLANKEYRVGDVIGGTTTVAYVGNGETFTVAKIGAGDNAFKIFSYDVNGNYSSGVNFADANVNFVVQQGNITDASLLQVNTGNIVITANVLSNVANETFRYDWTQNTQLSQSVLEDIDGDLTNMNFVINSSVLASGSYTVNLNVISSLNNLSTAVTLELVLSENSSPNPNVVITTPEEKAAGCTLVSTNVVFDPVLLLLFLISILALVKKRGVKQNDFNPP